MLWEHLSKFCTAYLNNILIYNSNLKWHWKHVWAVLTKLQEASIQTNMDKFEFYVIETNYLELIISTEEIKINSAKVKAIPTWSTSTNIKEMQLFIKVCNFYCYFIWGFFNIASPLNALTKKKIVKKLWS